MDRGYWVKKWQDSNDFAIEQNKLKKKMYIYAPYPKTNMYGFQSLEFRHILYADALARFARMNRKNVLFPTGCHSLCNSSYTENKKLSSYLNDDISNVYKNQMLNLGVGLNDRKFIEMRHDEYLANLQQAFIDFYKNGYIEYKDTKVYYDKKHNKIYDYMNKPEGTQPMIHKCFVLKLDDILDEVLKGINSLKLDDDIKADLAACFSPKRLLKMKLQLSNGYKLDIEMENPEYMGGVSFIFINPDYLDITNYVDVNEYNSVMSYLEGDDPNALFAYTGVTAINPLTGNEIPLFISTMYQSGVYLGIPDIDDDDYALTTEQGLEFIRIIRDDKLMNSDFLDNLSPSDAKDEIINAFVDADMATIETIYDNTEIVLSSLDTLGALFPFLEERDTGTIYSLEGHLPYTFNEKMRPVLSDDVDLPGVTMSGTINNMFTEGMAPILSMLYDKIGAIVPVFSNEAVAIYKDWNGIKLTLARYDNLRTGILMPLIMHTIISNVTGKALPNLFDEIRIYKNVVDIKHKEFLRTNGNLLDLDSILEKYNSDTIRLFTLKNPINKELVFSSYDIDDLDRIINKLEEILEDDKPEISTVDFALYKLYDKATKCLMDCNITEYAEEVFKFITEEVIPKGLSRKQALKFIKLIFPLLPFTADNTYMKVFGEKYSLINEEWEN